MKDFYEDVCEAVLANQTVGHNPKVTLENMPGFIKKALRELAEYDISIFPVNSLGVYGKEGVYEIKYRQNHSGARPRSLRFDL